MIDTTAHHGDEHHGEHGHVSSVGQLVGIFAVLMALTFLTVAATWIDLGPANVWIALFVAAVKAGVVAMWYMHLKYDNPFFGQILIASMFFLALFIGISLMDTFEYRPKIQAQDTADVQRLTVP